MTICMESGETGWVSGQLIMLCGKRISPTATWVPGPVTCRGCLRAIAMKANKGKR